MYTILLSAWILVEVSFTRFQSRIHCAHDDGFTPATAWEKRSCIGYNVCYDVREKGFVYFTSNKSSQPSIASLGPVSIDPKDGVPYAPAVFHDEPNPEDIHHVNEIVIPISRGQHYNVGHYTFDNLLPAYLILSMFGLLDHKNKTILVHIPRHPPRQCERFLQPKALSIFGNGIERFRKGCIRMPIKMAPVYPLHSAQDWGIGHSSNLSKRFICPRVLLYGLGYLSYSCKPYTRNGRINASTDCNVGRTFIMEKFRDMIMSSFNASGAVPEDQGFDVLFAWASTERAVANYYPLVEKLPVDLQKRVKHVTLHELPTQSQIGLLRGTKVYVSQCGGSTLFSSLFLPRHASLIQFCQGNFSFDWHYLPYMASFRSFSLNITTIKKMRRRTPVFHDILDSSVVAKAVNIIIDSLAYYRDARLREIQLLGGIELNP